MTTTSNTTMRRHLNSDGIYFSAQAQHWVWVGGPQRSLHDLGTLPEAYQAWQNGKVGDSTYEVNALDNAVHLAARNDLWLKR